MLLLMAGCAGSAAVSAQAPSTPAVRPEITPAPPNTESVEQVPRPRLRDSRPILRIAQPYTLPAGQTARDVQVVFGDVTIDGDVERDVVVTMGSARLGPTAVIGGTLAVVGGSATIDAAFACKSGIASA